MTFQDLIAKLSAFWAAKGAVVAQPYDMEMGAGTMHPETFFRVLGPRPGRSSTSSPPAAPPTAATAKTRTASTSTTSSSSS